MTLVEWIRRHSGSSYFGPQCEVHRPIAQMTTNEQLAALYEETGLVVSRQWLTLICRRLGVVRQGRSNRPRTVSDETKREQSKRRWRRWYERMRQDPERLKEYYRQHAARRTAIRRRNSGKDTGPVG
jgi:hypothetical protein